MSTLPTSIEPPRWTVQIRIAHVITLLAVQFLGAAIAIGIIYGRVQESMDDLARRITSIEQNRAVTRDEWQEMLHRFDVLEDAIVERNKEEDRLR